MSSRQPPVNTFSDPFKNSKIPGMHQICNRKKSILRLCWNTYRLCLPVSLATGAIVAALACGSQATPTSSSTPTLRPTATVEISEPTPGAREERAPTVAAGEGETDVNEDGPVGPAPTGGDLERPAPLPLEPMRIERSFPSLSFRRLTNLHQPDDGLDRIFVTEQAGRILVFPNDQEAARADVFLDIRERVRTRNNEEGLLGLAFDPEYSSNGYLYVYYSANGPRRSVLSRFTANQDDPNASDPQSELVILEIEEPFGNHNGGQIAFGPDGYLYVGVGDGGSRGDPNGNGQNRGILLGSLLRIDVVSLSPAGDYTVPPDNPFAGVAGARDEIWAYGLRNPWRFSFDGDTGGLWLADVGQNRWEEIDLVERGLNYGWNIMEGRHCFSPSVGCDEAGLELPVWEYSLSSGNCSAIGGYVYRGTELPSLLGAYVYGDFCSGRIWGLRYDGRSVTKQMLLVDSDLSITSFGQDLAHNLYVLSRNDGIYRLVPAR